MQADQLLRAYMPEAKHLLLDMCFGCKAGNLLMAFGCQALHCHKDMIAQRNVTSRHALENVSFSI